MFIENKQKISEIVMKGRSHNFCPIGQTHYTNNYEVVLFPNEVIPDYLDVQDFIEKEINDKELIIEDCVSMLFNHLSISYNPTYLKVSSNVTDAVHPEVTVVKVSD